MRAGFRNRTGQGRRNGANRVSQIVNRRFVAVSHRRNVKRPRRLGLYRAEPVCFAAADGSSRIGSDSLRYLPASWFRSGDHGSFAASGCANGVDVVGRLKWTLFGLRLARTLMKSSHFSSTFRFAHPDHCFRQKISTSPLFYPSPLFSLKRLVISKFMKHKVSQVRAVLLG